MYLEKFVDFGSQMPEAEEGGGEELGWRRVLRWMKGMKYSSFERSELNYIVVL